jgi:hypothetical protein
MSSLALILVAAARPSFDKDTAASFFFLTSGVKRYYTQTDKGGSVLDTVDVVGTEEIISNQSVFPISTMVGPREAIKVYYAALDDGVYQFADYDRNKFATPRAVLKAGDAEIKWDWRVNDSGFPLKMSYVSKPGKTRNVFGKDLPTLEMHCVGDYGDDDLAVHMEQDAIFAKGVGMIEMTEKSNTKKSKSSRQIKLTKITGGGW